MSDVTINLEDVPEHWEIWRHWVQEQSESAARAGMEDWASYNCAIPISPMSRDEDWERLYGQAGHVQSFLVPKGIRQARQLMVWD